MYTVRINSQLEDRLDAEFYNPEALKTVQKIDGLGKTKRLGQIISDGYRVVYHGTDSINGIAEEKLLPFLSPTQIDDQGNIDFSSVDKLPLYYKDDYPKGLAVAGELLIEVKGNVSKVGVVPEEFPKYLMISGSLYKASFNAETNSRYVLAFLKSQHGQVLKNRLTSNTIINYIAKDALYSIPLFVAEADVQKYIGDKVRQAERLRAWANTLNISVAAHFSGLVKNPLSPRVSWMAKKEDLDPYRINPKQYDPVVLDLIQRAKADGRRLEPLSSLIGVRQIAGGATPKGAQYFDKGILFARVQNVKPLRLDLSDAVYIDQFADEELARSRCAADDIILTITGYPGTASLVTEDDLPVNINQHSVRFNIKDGIESEYVCAALNSKFLKYQVDRLAIGGTRDALDYPSVGRLLIPRYEAEVEKNIGEQARCVIAAVKLSQRLTNAAKLLVEALIEGQLTEAELIAAEQALQAGNDQLDRRILNRLKTDGVDGQGPALFSDLDEHYRLLTQAEGD